MLAQSLRSSRSSQGRQARSRRRLLHEMLECRQLLAADGLPVWSVGASSETIHENEPGSESVIFELEGEITPGESASVALGISSETIGPDDIIDPAQMVVEAVADYEGTGDLEFDAGTGVLTFTPDDDGFGLRLAIPIITINDDLPEDDETAIVFLGSTFGSVIDPDHASQPFTILDDDRLGTPVWSVGATSSTINEDEPASEAVVFELEGDLVPGQTASVVLGIQLEGISEDDIGDPGQMVVDAIEDYDGPGRVDFDPSSGQLSFTPDDRGSRLRLVVPIITIDDDISEPEESAIVILENANGSVIASEFGSQRITILDDDSQPIVPVWSISATSAEILENEPGSESLVFSLRGDLAPGQSAEVLLGLELGGISGDDIVDPIELMNTAIEAYEGSGEISFDPTTATLSFTAGSLGGPMAPLMVPIITINDDVPERNESATVILGAAIDSRIDPDQASQTMTVIDDDEVRRSPVWSVGATSATIPENEPGSESVIFELGGDLAPGQSASVVLGLALEGISPNDLADPIDAVLTAIENYDGAGELSFDPESAILMYTADADGSAMSPLFIPIVTIDDDDVEPDESATVLLGQLDDSTVDPEHASQPITIIDDDVALPVWSVSATSETIKESESGSESIVFSLDGEVRSGESAAVQLGLLLEGIDATDIDDPIQMMLDAVEIYDGPGFLEFDPETAVLTYFAVSVFPEIDGVGILGSTMSPLEVPIRTINDGLAEGDESAVVVLGESVGSTTDPEQSSKPFTIVDDDALVWSVSSTSPTIHEDQPGSESVIFSLDGTLPAGESTSIVLGLIHETTSPEDFADPVRMVLDAIESYEGSGVVEFDPETALLTFAAGDQPASMNPLVVPIITIVDNEAEDDESAVVVVADPAASNGARVGAADDEQRITIVDQTQRTGIFILDGVVTVIGTDGRDVITTRMINRGESVRATLRSGDGELQRKDFPVGDVVGINIEALGGDDRVRIHQSLKLGASIDGGGGDDDITGGRAADRIIDLSGNNQISSGRGNDTVITGDGVDIINSGAGDDEVDAGNGRNVIRAGVGNDTIQSGSGNDLIIAGAGDDLVRVGGGNNFILGGNGHDILIGGSGIDMILGGRGRDIIVGGGNMDVLIGQQSSDLLIGGSTTHDRNDDALRAIADEWTSRKPLGVRKANLTDGSGSEDRLNGDNFLNADTVIDDETIDILLDASRSDWTIDS